MSHSEDHFDRLLTRFLDDEASPSEEAELNAQIRKHDDAAKQVEEWLTLEREMGVALRKSLRRPFRAPVRKLSWARKCRAVGALAAAAFLGLFVWMQPSTLTIAGLSKAVAANSAPVATVDTTDMYKERSPEYELPSIRFDKIARDWILVPGEALSEFFLLEVDRTKTQLVAIRGDF